jgi:hypothetical protein
LNTRYEGTAAHIRRLPEAAALAGLIMVLGSIALADRSWAVPGVSILPVVVGTLLVIQAGLGRQGRIAGMLAGGPLVAVGKLSYSWYLYHWPVLVFFRHAAGREAAHAETVGLVIFGFLLALASWGYVEEPLRRRRSGFRPVILGMCGASVLLVAVGLGAIAGKGFPQRLDESTANFYKVMTSANPFRSVCDGAELGSKNDRECNFGVEKRGASFDMAVFGDSNADHFVPMLSVLAKRSGFSARQVTQSTCAPLLGAGRRYDVGPRRALCDDYQREIIRFVEANPGLQVVALAAVWSGWVEGLEPGALADLVGPAGAFDNSFEGQLRVTLDYFARKGVRVLLLGQIPQLKPFDLGCYRNAVRSGVVEGRCPTGIGEVERQLALPRRVFAAQAAERPGVAMFDMSPLVCSETGCDPFFHGEFLYRDLGHLNGRGAVLLAPYAEQTFMNLIDRGRGD